jgi:hypothetical protein
MMDGVDDLAGVDALQVNRGDPEVGMPELPLDNRQRDAFVRHLNSMRMPQLMLVPTSAQAPLSRPGRYAEVSEKSAHVGMSAALMSA